MMANMAKRLGGKNGLLNNMKNPMGGMGGMGNMMRNNPQMAAAQRQMAQMMEVLRRWRRWWYARYECTCQHDGRCWWHARYVTDDEQPNVQEHDEADGHVKLC